MVEHKALLCILPFLCMCVNTYAHPPTYSPTPHTYHTHHEHTIPYTHISYILVHVYHTTTHVAHVHAHTYRYIHIPYIPHRLTYFPSSTTDPTPHTCHIHIPHTHTHTPPTPHMPHHTHRPLTFSYMYTTPHTHTTHTLSSHKCAHTPYRHDLGVVAHTYNCSTWEVKAGNPGVIFSYTVHLPELQSHRVNRNQPTTHKISLNLSTVVFNFTVMRSTSWFTLHGFVTPCMKLPCRTNTI